MLAFWISAGAVLSILLAAVGPSSAIYCYQCTSGADPGCGQTFYPMLHRSVYCSDVCVKITETVGADQQITRDCLTPLRAIRRDPPADQYEGCRKASPDPKLAVYVENSLKEVDAKRDHYDSVEFCMCQYDEECNASTTTASFSLFCLLAVTSLVMLAY